MTRKSLTAVLGATALTLGLAALSLLPVAYKKLKARRP